MSQGGQQPHVVPWDRPVWRVARRTDPVAFSRIEAAEATVDAGNRFDVRGGAVLYTGGSLECCFVETMARLRTSPAVVQAQSVWRCSQAGQRIGTPGPPSRRVATPSGSSR